MTKMHANRPPMMPEDEQESPTLPPPRCTVEMACASVGNTPLHDAAMDGDVKKVRAWLDLDADVNAKNSHGNTPLHIASREGKAEVVKLLRAQQGIDETIVNNFGQTPAACAKDDAVKAVFAQILRKSGIRPPVPENKQETPLHDAAMDGDVKKLKAHLALGADVNAQNSHGNTALHIAAREGKAEVVGFLRTHKDIDETIENNYGQTPAACAKDDATKAVFAQTLKKSGIRLPTEMPRDVEGRWFSDGQVVSLLMLSFVGTVPGIVGIGTAAAGMGAAGWVFMGASFIIMAVATHFIWNIMLDHEHDCEEKHKQKCHEIKTRERRLSFAIKMGVLDEVKRGLVDGLNPSGCEDNIPLHMAVAVGNAEIVRELLAHGADPNAQDAEGYTPVFRAIIAKKGEVVKALLESPHTDLDIANNDGQIPRNFMCLVEATKLPEERHAAPRKAQKPQMPELKL